jgi:hypothetical protein
MGLRLAFFLSCRRTSTKAKPGIWFSGLGLAAIAAAAQSCSKEETHCKAAAQIPFTGLPGTPNERTFIAIKPDGVQRGLIGGSASAHLAIRH